MTLGRRRNTIAGLILAFTLLATPAGAQGCSQCADQMRATPAPVRNAYRRAILFMVLAAGGVFTGAILTLRRFR